MFTVFVIIITHSLYSIDVSCGYPNSVYGNLAPLNRLVNEANKSANFALAEQTCCLTSTLHFYFKLNCEMYTVELKHQEGVCAVWTFLSQLQYC